MIQYYNHDWNNTPNCIRHDKHTYSMTITLQTSWYKWLNIFDSRHRLVLSSHESCILCSYLSSLPIFVFFFSSSFNYSLSMYSVYSLLYLNWERFSFVDCSQIISNWDSRYRFFLCLTETQNSDLLFWPIIHLSFMSCRLSWHPLQCLTMRLAMS